jgi:signal transduction histidine kinase
MKLFTKGLLMVAVPALCMVVFLGVLFQSQREADAATKWSLHSKEVLEDTNEVLATILTESVRFRGGLLSGEPSMAPDAFWDGLYKKLAELEVQVSDNPAQKAKAAQLSSMARDYRAALQRTYEMAQSTDPVVVKNRYSTLSKGGALNLLRIEAGKFLQEEKRLDALRTAGLEEARDRQVRVLIVVLVVSLLLSVFVVWMFMKSVGDRLGVLTLNAQRLADRQPLLSPVAGKDEISTLDQVLHQANMRLAEAEHREALAREELRERAHKLDELNQALAAQTQDNEMFVYSVSHDLRSPLVNLQGFGKEIRYGAQDLKEQIEASALAPDTKRALVKLIEEDIFSSLNFLDNAVLRSAAIIDALLRLSRAGRVEYTATQVDVQRIANRVVAALHNSLAQKGAKATVGTLPPAWADSTAVEQIIGNLVNNAVAYLDKNRPGEISVGALEHSAPEDDGRVTYFVRDNGMGIPAHLQGKLFVAFQRLHGNTSPGEGIGLALVRRVLDRNGGRIWVESTAGAGTTFYVALPAVPAAVHNAEAGTDPAPAAPPAPPVLNP